MFALAALGMLAAVTIFLVFLDPPVRTDLETVSAELPPDTPILLSVSNFGAQITGVTLTEGLRDLDGNTASERPISVRLVPGTRALVALRSDFRLQTEGDAPLLAYDGVYSLRVAVTVWQPAFPLPQREVVVRDYAFKTLTSPQPRVPAEEVQLGYQKPLKIQWNSPLQDFAIAVEPPAPVKSWVDPNQRDVAYVDLNSATPGEHYQIHILSAVGANSAPMQRPADVRVETAASPVPIADSLRLEWDEITLKWDRTLDAVQYAITPEVESTLSIDPADRRVSHIRLRDPVQGQEYRLKIKGGKGTTGAPIAETENLLVSMPPPLDVVEVLPGDGAFGVGRTESISITFGEPIADQQAAQKAITIDPEVPGYFQWVQPDRVEFVPEGELPELTNLTVKVGAGRGAVRGEDGAFLEEPFEFGFLTQPNKLIDIDLSAQRLVLEEGGEPVYSAWIASGVRFAETPTGDFMVLYKLESTRMRGVNPGGSRYDISNVPWVMAFLGDYTIHGAPWRSSFGSPQSNGCVSLSPYDAWQVYEWAPEGTPIRIHY